MILLLIVLSWLWVGVTLISLVKLLVVIATLFSKRDNAQTIRQKAMHGLVPMLAFFVVGLGVCGLLNFGAINLH